MLASARGASGTPPPANWLYGKQTLVENVRAGHARPLQGNKYLGEEVRIHDGSDF